MQSSKAYPLMSSMKGLSEPNKDLSPYLIHCTASWNPFTAFLSSLTFNLQSQETRNFHICSCLGFQSREYSLNQATDISGRNLSQLTWQCAVGVQLFLQ